MNYIHWNELPPTFTELLLRIGVNPASFFKKLPHGYLNGSTLKNYKMPDSIISTSSQCFQSAKLESIQLSNKLEEIGELCFYYCEKLKAITLPDTLKSIGRGAFAHCSSLISITIPKSVEYIEIGAFDNCPKLTIYCEAKSKPDGWHSKWAQNYSKDNINIVWDCKNNNHQDIVIDDIKYVVKPNGEAEVAGPIKNNITKVAIQNNVKDNNNNQYKVTSIRNKAFYDQPYLDEVYIPNTITIINNSAFYGSNNSTIDFVDFNTYHNLKNYDWAENVGDIIIGGKKVTSLILPNSIDTLHRYEFTHFKDLQSIKLPNSITILSPDVFNNNENIVKIELGDNVQEIYSSFSNCLNLEQVNIPKTLNKIYDRAFYNCDSLFELNFEGTIKECKAAKIGNKSYKGWRYGSSIERIICTDGVIEF